MNDVPRTSDLGLTHSSFSLWVASAHVVKKLDSPAQGKFDGEMYASTGLGHSIQIFGQIHLDVALKAFLR